MNLENPGESGFLIAQVSDASGKRPTGGRGQPAGDRLGDASAFDADFKAFPPSLLSSIGIAL